MKAERLFQEMLAGARLAERSNLLAEMGGGDGKRTRACSLYRKRCVWGGFLEVPLGLIQERFCLMPEELCQRDWLATV